MATFADLYTGLVSAWTLNEASGDRVDSKGDNDLSMTNDGGRRLGHLGYGVDIVDDDTSPTLLKIADADQDGLEPTANDFSVSLWFNEDEVTVISNRVLVCKSTPSSISWILQLGFADVNGIEFVTSADGSSTDTLLVEAMPSQTYAHHVVITWDNSTRTKKIYLNGTLRATGVVPTPHDIYNGTQAFCVGHLEGGTLHFDGLIDDICYWNKVVSADEVTLLWNDGLGASLYPELVDNLELNINFNNRSQLEGYRRIIENTLAALKNEPSRYEIDGGEVIVDNRGRVNRLLALLTFIDDELHKWSGISEYQGPDREMY